MDMPQDAFEGYVRGLHRQRDKKDERIAGLEHSLRDALTLHATELALRDARIAELEREVERLRGYASHKYTCELLKHSDYKCSCGLDALLDQAREKE